MALAADRAALRAAGVVPYAVSAEPQFAAPKHGSRSVGCCALGSERWLVVGATSWGLTLAQCLARAAAPVTVLARDAAEAALVRERRTHPARSTAVCLPPAVRITDAPEAARDCEVILLATPAQSLRDNAARIAEHQPAGAVVVSAAKGIETSTGMRMSEVLSDALGARAGAIVALSGPNLADEVARGKLATTVVASADRNAARLAQSSLTTPQFRVYTHDDVIGVELGGALKNIIALAAGIGDGLDSGDNAKAALLTRGLAEISRLGVAMGADPLTFAGLSGLGDLIATCASPLSRNRRVGEALGRGRRLHEVLATLGHVAEGVPTTAAARMLASRYGVTMPVTEEMYRVLFEDRSPVAAARALMEREPRAELPL